MVRFHRFASTPRSIAWTLDGRWLIVGNDDGTVVQLDPISLRWSVISKQDLRPLDLAVGADSASVIVSDGSELRAISFDKISQ